MEHSYAVSDALKTFRQTLRSFTADSEDGYFAHLQGKDDAYLSKFTVEELIGTRKTIEIALDDMTNPRDRYDYVQELKNSRFVRAFLDPNVGYIWQPKTDMQVAVSAEEALDTFRSWFEAVARKCSAEVLGPADDDKKELLRRIDTRYNEDSPWSPKNLL